MLSDISRCQLLVLLILVLGGCGGASSGVVVPRNMDPDQVSQNAMDAYDANGDGSLDKSELANSPGLQSALTRVDADKNQAVSKTELAARFRAYQGQEDLVAGSVLLLHKGKPLAGATVMLQPEPFMGSGLQSYQGVSDEKGRVPLVGQSVKIPGIPVGLYTANVSRAKDGIDKVVGCELASDVAGANRQGIVLVVP